MFRARGLELAPPSVQLMSIAHQQFLPAVPRSSLSHLGSSRAHITMFIFGLSLTVPLRTLMGLFK
eukprot:1940501-Amphidinium_carterae.2